MKGEGRVFPNVSLTGVELEIDKYNYFRRTPDVTGEPVWGNLGTACGSAPRTSLFCPYLLTEEPGSRSLYWAQPLCAIVRSRTRETKSCLCVSEM